MSRRSSGPGPISSLIGAVFGTAFCSIFLIVGCSLALYGYVKYNDAGIYSKTPVVSVSDIKEDQIAKFILKSESINSYEATYSKTPCVFYRLEYVSYSEDSDGDLTSSVDEIKSAPDQLTLESNDKRYLVSLVNPQAEFYFKNTLTYLKNWQTKQYEPTTKIEFRSGDNIVRENFIAPEEDVLIFGKVKKIIPGTVDGLTTIEFKNIELGDPFNNIGLFYSNLFNALLSNELTSYIVSTKPSDSLDEELNSMENTTGLIFFGLIFCIIPIIIVVAVWFSFIKSILSRL